jgi:hypothetical protein
VDEQPTTAPRWSGEVKAWLIFWIMLAVATPILLLCFPDWFTWHAQAHQGRRFPRRLPAVEDWPTFGLGLTWLFGAVGWVVWFRNKRRSEGLTRVAQQRNLELTAAPADHGWMDMQAFAFFRIGFEHSARNRMTGKLGRYSIEALDYHFRRSALPRDVEIQTSSRKYHQTVVAFWHVSRKFPDFQLVSRESWWSRPGKNRSPKGCVADLKIGKALNNDFFKNYLVGGANEDQLQEFFTPLLMEYFCAHRGWDIESAGSHLLIYQERRLQRPAMMAGFLDQALEIAETLRGRAEEERQR